MESKTSAISRLVALAACIAAGLFLTGCSITGGSDPDDSTNRRSSGQFLADQENEMDIGGAMDDSTLFNSDDHVKIEVHNSVVLLVGTVTTQEKKYAAGRIASEPNDIRRVVNELVVSPEPGFWSKADNGWDSTRVNTALLTRNPIEGFDATRIKVVTSQDTVYLMGLVSKEEADAVTEVARNVGGVKRVVRVFDYTD